MLETEELIDSRIGVHDDNQFEVKLDYAIDPTSRSNRYSVETYLFVPTSLGLDPYSYRRKQFYADIQAYIRFKTPTVTLRALLDEDNGDSPLNRFLKRMPKATSRDAKPDVDGPLGHEVRLFGCLVRVNVRDQVKVLRERVEALEGRADERAVLVEDVVRSAQGLASDVTTVLEKFRALRPEFMHPRRPGWVKELYEYADEYVSLSVEHYLTRFVSALDANEQVRAAASGARTAIVARITAEQKHRRAAGYDSVLGDEHGSALYVHRKSALKKFMSSVLFLDMDKQTEGRRVANIAAGIAAAVAMLFSTIAAIWSQNRYGINSYPFVFALVISYVFKDRIKEWLRTYFNKQFSRWLWDYSVTIRDPEHDVVVGRCRESFNFVSPSDLPSMIYRARHQGDIGTLEPLSKPETVIKYVKQITLRGKAIAKSHRRMLDVNDIIRFNVSSLLARMDDPVRTVESFHQGSDRVRHLSCPKAYHVNVVLVLRGEGKRPHVERFRVVLDKVGIRELHEVEGPSERLAAPASTRHELATVLEG